MVIDVGGIEPSTLCEKCLNLDIYPTVQRLLQGETEPNNYYSNERKLQVSNWYNRLDEISRSSLYCSLCSLIMRGWREERKVENDLGLLRDKIYPSMMDDVRKDITEIEAYLEFNIAVTIELERNDDIENSSSNNFLRFRCEPNIISSWDPNIPVVSSFRLTFSHSVDLPPSLKHVYADPNSPWGPDIAKKWLSTCTSQHDSCDSSTKGFPDRFLDISDCDSNGLMYLRELKDFEIKPDARYIALSHCWGPNHGCITLDVNLIDHKRGKPIFDLPKTFQDAIDVAKTLNISYLWIDCLCIIQNDTLDWQIQASKMATIYRDAHLVLSADRSTADTEGFLQPRRSDNIVTISHPEEESNNISFQLRLQPPRSKMWWSEGLDPLHAEPINRRTWCLQERYLPRRILHFGSDQMFWQCECVSANEEGYSFTHENRAIDEMCENAGTQSTVFSKDRAQGWSEEFQRHGKWYKMLEDYTSRLLTEETDRLPALMGLAKAVSAASADEFVAGVWKSTVLEGLMWIKAEVAGSLQRPAKYIAPSWSWASVKGGVQFVCYAWWTSRCRSSALESDFEPLASLVSYHLDLRDLDHFGRLKDGSRMVLHAAVLPVISMSACQEDAPGVEDDYVEFLCPKRSLVADKVFGIRMGDKGKLYFVEGAFDIAGESLPTPDQLFIIFLARMPRVLAQGSDFTEYRFGLIVRRVENGAYNRVGFVDGFVLEGRGQKHSRWNPKKWITDREKLDIKGFRGRNKPDAYNELPSDLAPNTLAYNPFKLVAEDVVLE